MPVTQLRAYFGGELTEFNSDAGDGGNAVPTARLGPHYVQFPYGSTNELWKLAARTSAMLRADPCGRCGANGRNPDLDHHFRATA